MYEQFEKGFMQAYMTDPDKANDTALNGAELPEGRIMNSLVPDGVLSGWNLYWIGDTLETAQDPDQPLIFMLYRQENDELDVFRTSVNSFNNHERPIDLSLYMFRDSKSDRMEKEQYNMMFFDTPAGKDSMVKIVTDVLGNRTMQTPKPFRIKLRAFHLQGVEMPVYSMSNGYIAMVDGTKGSTTLFDDMYHNTFDGDTFESDYVKVEGIATGDLDVTIKQGQPVWPEWTGADSCETIGGERFIRVDGVWNPEAEASATPTAQPAGAEAA